MCCKHCISSVLFIFTGECISGRSSSPMARFIQTCFYRASVLQCGASSRTFRVVVPG